MRFSFSVKTQSFDLMNICTAAETPSWSTASDYCEFIGGVFNTATGPTSPPRSQRWFLSCFAVNCSGLDPVWRLPGLDPVAGCDHCRDNGPATSLHGVVRIHTDHHVYATNTNIAFVALTDFDAPKEFLWYFGDSRSTRSHSRAISIKYQTPGRYDVFVIMSVGGTSFRSEVFQLVIQTPVRLNRLVHQASILQNQTMAVSCRVNSGTDLVYTWRFGDGTVKSGGQREQHVFHRIGEFTIEVMVSNLVSSASLHSQLFVVDRPCQPPSVKNMGPRKIQMRRFEVTHLGVTYDADIDCDHAAGLTYSWQLFDSAGGLIPLTNTHRQSLTVPSYLLQCDTYTAVARVAVIGSVVYSNYSVKLEVVPSSPVASIHGATNILVNKWNNDMVVLDGRESHNPDYPEIPVSFTWTCEPVSSIKTSCFNQHVNTSSSLLQFPVNSLKGHFDQFHVTLTVHSGQRWASSEVFVTLTSQSVRKMMVHCPQCQGDQVNWDQPFTLFSGCVDCDVSSDNIQYTWNLYTVNATTKPVFEVPFCYLAQLGAPSHLIEGSTTTKATPGPPPSPTAETSPHTGNGILTRPLDRFTHMEPLNLQFHEDNRPLDASGFRIDAESSADWTFDYAAAEIVDYGEGQDYDVSKPVTEEGDPGKSPGRPMSTFSPIVMSNKFNYNLMALFSLPGVDGEILIPGDDLHFTLVSHDNQGSNLVDSSRAAVIQKSTLLDLARVPVNRQLFESFTHSGTSSSALSFRPFSLKQSSRYMLQVTATSSGSSLGHAQIFLVVKPAPKGMTCQVQPTVGTELYTQFSIFCASGRTDLVYEYSYSVGARPAQIMYKGTDFQYFFHLPSGEPSNDYRVTIYTRIRSSLFGTSTKVCPVHVQVQPSFVREMTSADPESQLSKLSIETLTPLVKLGNEAEIRNYISLLSNVLNRTDGQNISAQRRLHSVLVCTMCELEADSQASMLDNISVLKDLLRVSSQVTMLSVKRVTAHIQTVSLQFSDPTGPSLYNLDQQMLRNLLTLLSYSLQAAEAHYIPKSAENTQDIILETFIQKERILPDNGCTKFPYISMKTRKRIVRHVLQLASELIMVYVSLLKVREHKVITGGMFFHMAHLNQSFSTLSCSSCSLYMPTSLTRLLHDREKCVVTLLAELTHSPYTWARYPPQMSGPVIDMSLYKCSSKNKISIRALVEPIIIEVHRPERDQETSMYELLRGSISYHSFNITEKLLQQSIQLRVKFSPAADKPFPIMLLFRMYERPTPSTYHRQKFYQWKSLSTYITFPPSYFNAAGLGHLALLNADFERPLRNHHLSRQINYSLEIVTTQCLSWDEPRDGWTHHGCRTHQTEATAAVNCSCYHLRPLTVAQEQIPSLHDTTELDPSLSVSSDLSIVSVLLVVVCLFVPMLVMCRRADLISKDDQRVHYLADNSPWDSHLYAVTIHTGLCSAARMSAKVFIVLYGEDGVSQTRELQVPGCTLFGKNSQNTFILSVSEHLGPVRGLHIWHDNSGPSPFWYIKLIEVAEVNSLYVKQQTWFFLCQCWLAVSQGDGQVERRLRSTRAVSLAQMWRLRLPDYLSDYHIWMSVYSHPRPSSFTHTQRLGLCLLLLLGYAGANTVVVSQMNQLLPSDLGFVCVSSLAVRTGFLSVMAVLPLATLVDVFFRWCAVKNKHTSQDSSMMSGQTTKAHHAWLNLQKQDGAYSLSLEDLEKDASDYGIFKKTNSPIQRLSQTCLSGSIVFEKCHMIDNTGGIVDTWKGTEQLDGRSDPDIIRDSPDTKGLDEKKKNSQWFPHLAWTLCLLLSLHCFLISAVLGSSFSDGKVLLWIHSFFFSLLFCIFFIQPALILALTAAVCFNTKVFRVTELETLTAVENFSLTLLPERPQTFEKLLGARRRARYLQLVRPPSHMDLRNVRARKTRENRIGDTVRDLCVCVAMIMTLMNSGSSVSDQQPLNTMIQQQLTWEVDGRRQTDADWWEWVQNQLLDVMYNNNSAPEALHHILIGKPLLQKMDILESFQCQVLRMTVGIQGHQGCEQGETVHLGHTRSEAAHKLKVLELGSWLGKGTMDIKVRFTFFSPAPNLFTTVTSVAERRLTGVLLPPAKVQSVQLLHRPALHDYGAMVCQLLFVVLSLLHLWLQIYAAGQQGLIRYCKSPWKWLELIVLLVTLLYLVRHMDQSSLLKDVVDLMQRHQYREHVDVSQLATREQEIQSLRGILLLLLVVKCVTVVKVNKTVAPNVNCTKRLRSVISSVILLVAVSIIRSLLSKGHNLEISGSNFLHYRALSLSSAVLLSTLTMSFSSIKKAKPSQSRTGACTVAELVDYIRRKARELTAGPPQTDVDVKRYYLEEFDCLLDELLYRLNSLYYTLPGPSLTPEPVDTDSQSWTETALTSDQTGLDAQDLGLNKKGTGGEEPCLKGQTNLFQEEDLIREGVSSQSFEPTLHSSHMTPNCFRRIEDDRPMARSIGNVLVEVVVHQEP
ncbi:polycystic kidney disease 1 like 1 isoform X1 [Synchiropus splendidus]|uniref:polycystic kidney disease 1 like 1 isoform X1 n=1 Tax=Synchiropus splendidus TaxID=270530 RepID=UPI00237DF123|nr:polycystic kidney disease 1 like 1 isoform X1 [Synchiropus splendidus]